jgi:hypothetical protein
VTDEEDTHPSPPPSHPATKPAELPGSILPDVDPEAAPGITLELPSDPAVPDFREMSTAAPGPFQPSKEPEDPIVVAVRNAVREEMEVYRAQFDIINDPNLGVLGVLRSLEEPMRRHADDMATLTLKATKMYDLAKRMFDELEKERENNKQHKEAVEERLNDHARRIRDLERWREATRDDGR